MKNLLIISPYFPPSNAADIHRIRMSLPYFEKFGWKPEVVTVESKYLDGFKDETLSQTIPKHIKIHFVKAFSKKWTSKIGLGSVALRSLWFYKQKVNQILKLKHFDLIYFSTTQFPICILGPYWKKKFGIPYVIDMQDPWHTDYYKDKPKNQRPPKYWFSYRLNKFLEPIAMKRCDGIIAVSEKYINDLKNRYVNLINVPTSVITFGYSDIDLKIAEQIQITPNQKKTLIYIGVLGPIMNKSLNLLFSNLPEKIKKHYQLVFKGTSYALLENAKKSTTNYQEKYQLKNVIENTDRLGMFQTLKELNSAEGLLIIGTDEAGYTASKLYPYLQANKPILAILHTGSSANEILKKISNAIIINLDDDDQTIFKKFNQYLFMLEQGGYVVHQEELGKFSAEALTKSQCQLFDSITKS